MMRKVQYMEKPWIISSETCHLAGESRIRDHQSIACMTIPSYTAPWQTLLIDHGVLPYWSHMPPQNLLQCGIPIANGHPSELGHDLKCIHHPCSQMTEKQQPITRQHHEKSGFMVMDSKAVGIQGEASWRNSNIHGLGNLSKMQKVKQANLPTGCKFWETKAS